MTITRAQTRAALVETDWRPIEDAIDAAKANDGWIGRCLFGKWICGPSGDYFHSWVGQCDAGDIWLASWLEGSCGICSDCAKPDWYMPLPPPPERGWLPPSPEESAQ